MIRYLTIFLSCISILGLWGQQDTYESINNMPQLMIHYQADHGSLSRFYHIQGSPERRERFVRFYTMYRDHLSALSYDAMSVSDQVDYHLMIRKIDNELYLLQKEKEEVSQIDSLIGFGAALYNIEAKRRRGIRLNASSLAGTLGNISSEVTEALEQLKISRAVYDKHLVQRAVQVLRGQQEALKSIWNYYKGYDPEFTWWVKMPKVQMDSVYSLYIEELKNHVDPSKMNQDDGSGIVGKPTGRNELLRLLKRDMIPYTPEELVEIAQKEFAWCDQELLKASREMGFGNDWRAAQEKVKQSYVSPGEQPEAMVKLYNESVDFLKKHNLLTIPPLAEETWRMQMLSPKQQLISPFFLGGETLMIAYPTDEMTHEAKMMSMRGNNPHFSRATVHHELIAGHHLQGYMNRRYKTHRRGQFRTPFWMEGWALYWELLLYEKGFPQSPEDRIGMLFWRMHRCARIMFSLNYHLGVWTPQQCIDFLVDRVGHERDNAEAEVRRSFTTRYPPLYQLAYMTGGLQFYALKQELVDSGTMTFRQFHDAVLHENAMPVELLRFILKKESVPKNYDTSWRFYNR